MKKILLLPFLGLLIYACSGKSDLSTPEKFTDQLVAAINDKDTSLFNDLFAHGSDYDEILKTAKFETPGDEQMAQQHKARMLADLVTQQTTSYKAVTDEIKKVATFQLNLYEIEENEGYKMIRNLEIEVETPEHHKKVIRIPMLLQCGTKWKSFGPINPDEQYLN